VIEGPDGRALRVVAVVPARGGTDPIPYLNLKRLGDRPLLAHTVAAAKASALVDRVVVTTDDERVAEVARAHGAEVPFLRPRELAADLPSLKPVVAHAVRALEQAGETIDVVVILQVTTPFRDTAAVDGAVRRLLDGGYDTVVSVTEDRT
jgi:CMP-N-acetylneuraminic acid synthetase